MASKRIDTVAIVDGASTSVHLAPGLRSYGINCVHILSSESLPDRLKKQIKHHDYIRSVVHHGDVAATASELRDLNIDLVLPGGGSGVELASWISAELGAPFQNPVELATARRDKYEQIETLMKAGISTAQQFQSRSPTAIVSWVEAHLDFPVVVKPTRGAGVRGVKICRDFDQVTKAANTILNEISYYGEEQDRILVQSYLEGQEYIVDAVSFDGRHKLVSVWEVERVRESSPRLEKMIVVDHNDARLKDLIDYAWSVLSAVGFDYGPSHMEVMITKNGPRLIELNSRLHGSLDPRLTTAVNGHNHVSQTVNAIVNPVGFIDSIGKPDTFFGFCGHVLLTSPKAGILSQEFPWDLLSELPSFNSVKRWVSAGQQLQITTDLQNAVGMVGLFHRDYEQLIRDCGAIREIENLFFMKSDVILGAFDV